MTERTAEESRAIFEELTIPCMRTLYNRALSLIRRPDVAADLVQETYLRAYRTFGNFAPGTNAKAWLLTILYSVFVNRYRKEQREPDAISLEEADDAGTAAIEEQVGRGTVLDPRMWASGEVHAALQKIPTDFRTTLLMVDVDDLSYEEAAAALGCPVGTIRSRLSRARRMLYLELREYARARGLMKADS